MGTLQLRTHHPRPGRLRRRTVRKKVRLLVCRGVKPARRDIRYERTNRKPKKPRPRFADALAQLTAGEPAPSECGAQPAGTVSCAGIRQILHKTTSFFRFIPIVQSRQGGCRMCEMKSLLAARQPNPLSTLVPLKNPVVSKPSRGKAN